jgi:site-specific recombinase XerD
MNPEHTEILKNFFNFMQSKKFAQKTCLAYAQDVRQFLTFITLRDINYTRLEESHVHLFIEDCKQKFSTISIQRKIGSLKLFWRFRGRIPTTTMAGTITRPEPKTIADDMLLSLIAACEHSTADNTKTQLRNSALLIILLRVKVPASQLAQLRKENVSIKSTSVTVLLLTGQKITIALPQELLEKLHSYSKTIENDTYFFQTTSGAAMTSQAIRALPEKLMRSINTNTRAPHTEDHLYSTTTPGRLFYDQLHPRR